MVKKKRKKKTKITKNQLIGVGVFVVLLFIVGFLASTRMMISPVPGQEIATFEGSLDNFTVGCGGNPNYSYVEGRVPGTQAIKLWAEGKEREGKVNNTLACLQKLLPEGANQERYTVYFYGKGYVRAGIHYKVSNEDKGYMSYIEEVATGERTNDGGINAWNLLNNGTAYEDWTFFKLTTFKNVNTTNVRIYFYNKYSTRNPGEEFAGYYDTVFAEYTDVEEFEGDNETGDGDNETIDEEPEPECLTDSDCSLGVTCLDGMCVVVAEPEPDDEGDESFISPEPEEDSTLLYILGGVILLGIIVAGYFILKR